MPLALELPVTWMLFGTMLGCMGLMLLGDYRRIVLSKPRLVTVVRVFLHRVLHPTPTNTYLGIVFVVLSACLFIASMLALAVWFLSIVTGLNV